MQFKAIAFIAVLCTVVSVNGLSIKAQSDLCLKICAPVALECAEGWSSRRLGDCFTCCKDEDSAALPAVVSVKAQAPGICWRACFFEKPQCPEGWNANQRGECWTCCTGDDDLVSPGQTPFQMNCNI